MCFEKEFYEKPLLENPSETIFRGGSNNLSVEVSNDNVLEATIGAGKIKIKTKKNGIVYLVVKDKTIKKGQSARKIMRIPCGIPSRQI